MKQCCFILVLLANVCSSWSQNDKHQFSIDAGSYRNRYLYPITNISYQSPTLFDHFDLSVRLRSYGTFYFYTKDSYDVSPIAYYTVYKNEEHQLIAKAGLGADLRLRFVNDERSSATTSCEPIVALNLSKKWSKLKLQITNWNRFYQNGISFNLMPEIQYDLGKRFFIYGRYEWTFLQIYQSSHEWRQDCFIGVGFKI
jgi:hypothetical protein